MHQTLYRKWRPQTFDEVSGQKRTTEVLKYEIANGKTTHAYLFCGSRGTGKTSCAKIFAKAVNCLDPQNGNPCGRCDACRTVAAEATTDIIEMDAASNNGVDYIRDIRDSVVFAPAMLKYKVFIIDEVHMLSQAAFNALLKTLEEPPERVIFILATTEVNKLPVTVVSRCQRFDFSRLTVDEITARLRVIADAEGISLDERASRLIAKLARGGMRDAVSLLELCAGDDSPVDVKRVSDAAGISSRESVERTFRAVFDCDRATIFDEIGGVYSSSLDVTEFWQQLIEYCRDLMVVKVNPRAGEYLELTDRETEALREEAKDISFDRLVLYSQMLDDTLTDLQKGTYDNRVLAEMTLVRMASKHPGSGADALAARIGELERRINELESSAVTAKPAQKPKKTDQEKKPDPQPEGAEVKNSAEPEGASSAERDISDWADVLEQIGKADGFSAGFLSSAFAAFDPAARGLTVFVPDDFSLSMLDKEQVRKLIADSAASVDPRYVGTSVSFAVKQKANNEKSEIDQILE